MGRWIVLPLAVAVVVVVGLLAAWAPAGAAGETLALLPGMFPAAPVDPLAVLSPTPAQREMTFPYAGGMVTAQVFQPAASGRHPAIVLLLGAGDLPRSDVAVHFAQDLARLGIVVSVPESSGMLAERLDFNEVDAIRQSLLRLADEPEVDSSRIGLVGLSASGGLAIVAAAQPDLRERVRLVNSFGSYDDASLLLVDVASRSIEVNGQQVAWQPEPRTQDVVANALLEVLDGDADGAVQAEVDELLSGTSRARAQALVAALPARFHQQLAAISPATYLGQVRAHLYLMHDRDDPFIPFTQSRMLVAQAPPGLVVRYTEFSIFAHVIPDRPVPWQTFVPDLWKLFWRVQAVLLELA